MKALDHSLSQKLSVPGGGFFRHSVLEGQLSFVEEVELGETVAHAACWSALGQESGPVPSWHLSQGSQEDSPLTILGDLCYAVPIACPGSVGSDVDLDAMFFDLELLTGSLSMHRASFQTLHTSQGKPKADVWHFPASLYLYLSALYLCPQLCGFDRIGSEVLPI